MSFTQLKLNGKRTRIDLSKVRAFYETDKGTLIEFDNGDSLSVEESYQTVSNRAAKGQAVDAEPVAASVTGL